MKRRLWTAAALGLATIGLAACSEAPAPVEEGAPEAPDGIAVANGRLMLPAVAGNPAAVYFDVSNSGADNRMIRAASVAGAGRSMMHTTDAEAGMQETLQVMVPPGETVKFEPGGTHVMAMDLADTVTAGGEAEVTLTFVGGDKVSFPAAVRAAGDER
ncbi:MAG TPA: copper chaperone PCu(A)C [Croceibacterium sp.]|nr:copper chaperone PCu(A)C [Croceibacterium sp.]